MWGVCFYCTDVSGAQVSPGPQGFAVAALL